jgi:hypothetical protein
VSKASLPFTFILMLSISWSFYTNVFKTIARLQILKLSWKSTMTPGRMFPNSLLFAHSNASVVRHKYLIISFDLGKRTLNNDKCTNLWDFQRKRKKYRVPFFVLACTCNIFSCGLRWTQGNDSSTYGHKSSS